MRQSREETREEARFACQHKTLSEKERDREEDGEMEKALDQRKKRYRRQKSMTSGSPETHRKRYILYWSNCKSELFRSPSKKHEDMKNMKN
ncbi:hypothetical protein AOLI_G00107780 [Acnodon oligacanthus]